MASRRLPYMPWYTITVQGLWEQLCGTLPEPEEVDA